MNAAARVTMNLSFRDHVLLWSQLWCSYIGSRLSKELHTSCVCLCITSTLDQHHNPCQTVHLQFLHSVADTSWGRLAQRIAFSQEQELDLENEVSPTVAQPPGIFFLPTSTTLTPVHSDKKLSYRRGTARWVVSVEILPIATQQCRNYLYDKSWTNLSYEVRGLRWVDV